MICHNGPDHNCLFGPGQTDSKSHHFEVTDKVVVVRVCGVDDLNSSISIETLVDCPGAARWCDAEAPGMSACLGDGVHFLYVTGTYRAVICGGANPEDILVTQEVNEVPLNLTIGGTDMACGLSISEVMAAVQPLLEAKCALLEAANAAQDSVIADMQAQIDALSAPEVTLATMQAAFDAAPASEQEAFAGATTTFTLPDMTTAYMAATAAEQCGWIESTHDLGTPQGGDNNEYVTTNAAGDKVIGYNQTVNVPASATHANVGE